MTAPPEKRPECEACESETAKFSAKCDEPGAFDSADEAFAFKLKLWEDEHHAYEARLRTENERLRSSLFRVLLLNDAEMERLGERPKTSDDVEWIAEARRALEAKEEPEP